MRELDKSEIKAIQLEILDAVVAFCCKNNINYWLESGTLIGAIRHKGYIPWDDDIDLGMLREDYDRLIKEFNDENERFKCYSIENNEKFLYPFAKVIDTRTTMYVPNKDGIKLSVHIDVFVFDNAPDDDVIVAKMFRKRDFWMTLHGLRVFRYPPKGNIIHRVLTYVCRAIVSIMPRNFYVKRVVANSKKYCGAQTRRVGNFVSMKKVVADKDIFDSFIEAEFERKKYSVPVGYDRWLKAFYGDYLTLPSAEERVPMHNYPAYIND